MPYVDSYFHQNQDSLPLITATWVLKDYEQISRFFNYRHSKKVPLIVMGSPTLFEQTNVTQGLIPEGVGGFTESMKNRIVIPFSGDYQEFKHVLHHELVHAFQFGVLFENTSQALMRGGSAQLPLWFAEGLAEFLSSGWSKSADMFMMDQIVYSEVAPPGPMLGGYMSYKGGQSFFYYLWSIGGEQKFMTMLDKFRTSKRAIQAIEDIYNESIEELGKRWIQQLKQIYWPEIGHRLEAEYNSKAITNHIKQKAFVNIKPKISGKGDKIAFYTDKKDNAGIIITDSSGKKIDFISQFGNGSFFESFQPFRSGFTFSPDGNKIAFITKSNGRNDIRIKDLVSGKIIKKISTPSLNAISSLDWSKNGKDLLFTGLSTDRGDLYTYDIHSDKLTRLTNDIYYEKDARFSPSGNHIIYNTCDTSGDISQFPYNMSNQSDLFLLSILDKSTKQLTKTAWNEKQATFSPDGKSIAFISDHHGIDNIYIMNLDSLESSKCLTNYIGSCSFPYWSTESNEIVFSLFQKQAWNIRKISTPVKMLPDSTPKTSTWVKFKKKEIDFFYKPNLNKVKKKSSIKKDSKKRKRKDNTIDEKGDKSTQDVSISEEISEEISDSLVSDSLVSDSLVSDSLVSDSIELGKNAVKIKFNLDTLSEQRYRLKFQPDAVVLGLAFNSMYGYGGQGAISFSDLLGNHQMAIAANIQGNLKETGLYLSYFNTKFRTDFGGSFFLDRYYTYSDYDLDLLQHRTVIGVNGIVRFPFSIFQRIDFNLLFKNISDDPQKIEGSKILEDPEREDHETKVFIPSVSHVYDNILWGITGPARGFRSKTTLMFQPTLSQTEASFISLDTDLRHYLHIGRKFVWANRMAVGFSEPLGDKDVERKFFLGGNNYWLFYYLNIDSYKEQYNNSTYSSHILPFRGWDYFDITGTRFAVINTEFRFPFVKELNIAWPLPVNIRYINGAVFADIGNAWEPEDQYKNIPLPKKIYGGIGMGMRINLGIFVLRYDLAWKTDWTTYVKDSRHYWSLGAEF